MANQGGHLQPPRKELPIFTKNKVNFTPQHPITHLCVCNNKVVIAMQNKVILKIDLKNPDHPEEMDLKKHQIDAKLSNMFLDPSGQHLILAFSPKDSVNPAEALYLGPKADKPKEIPSLKTHLITAVAWNQDADTSTPNSTYPLLLGTSKGSIFEAEIVSNEIKNAKLVYDIGKGSAAVISGLEYFFLPKTNTVIILVATSKRIYQFKGTIGYREDRPWFSSIFNAYISQTSEEYYKEFGTPSPSGGKFISDHAISRLHIHYVPGLAFPSSIAYLTDNGARVSADILNSGSSSYGKGDEDFLAKLVLVPYPKFANNTEVISEISNDLPKSLVATDYHILLLYKGNVKAVCVLNEDVIFEDNYTEMNGRLMNIIRDPVKGSIWCFTERLIFRYSINEEERNIWRIFLDKGDFIKAQEFSKHDPTKLEAIAMKQAEHCFSNKEYDMSAMYYAMTKASFEEIALKFVQVDNSHALKTFLMKKMSSLKSQDLAKITALVLWLIEIFLNELGSLRDFGKQSTVEYKNLDEEFLHFMAQPLVKECVSKNKKAVYDLMASHGDKENLIHFTLVMKDYDEVIENSINNGQYQAALTTLLKQKDAGLYSRFIPTLLDKDPKATIDVLITAGRMLNPIKLLPKFSSKLERDIATQVTRYLEHCVNAFRIQDQTVHDYLISLYIHYYSSEKLMEYLEHQGTNVHTVRYDPKYALMMCLEKKLHYPSIHLYTLMGLYEEAVGLAIQVDLELAKKVADFPEEDTDMRKKLWLKIAKHVVKEKNDIQQAMEFLQQCDLLKIEDILPFFPDFVTIDHFKDAICSSLQEYNQHIQNLKYEMDEATKSAEIIQEEIQAVRNRCAIVRAIDQCTVCENTLLIRNFYVFPCGHKFHADCLLSEVYPTLTEPRKKLLQDYQKKLSEATNNHDIMSTGSATISARDQIKSDIDDIVASECIYCGDTMIKLIDAPFISEDDYSRIQRDWE